MTLMTVRGPVTADQMGMTLLHEHVRVAFPGWDLEAKSKLKTREEEVSTSVERMQELLAYGVNTFVDPCPMELGRDVTLLQEMSEKSGMNIVCSTGFYYEEDGQGIPFYWRTRWPEEVAELYLREINEGVGDTGIKPGVIKAATSNPVGKHDKKMLVAAGIASKESGLPVITHTTHSGGVMEQIEAFEAAGLDPSRVLIGHQDQQEDYDVLLEIVRRDYFVGFDRIGMNRQVPDAHRADLVTRLINDGYQHRIALSQDHMCYDPHPRPLYWIPKNREEEIMTQIHPLHEWEIAGHPHTQIITDFFPLLRERGISDEQIQSIMIENPRRFLLGA